MSLAHIPLERLQQSDLQGLIEGQTAEARQIEYKRETYGGNDSARAEFLADVSSFANALGGDLIVGMEANAGIPTAITAFPGDADAECLRLDQIARSGIEPRIQNLEIRAIPIATGGVVIMLRIPRSYNQPHRVSFQGRNRFWARSSVGKYEPSVDELRAIFAVAPLRAERMRQLRIERITAIAAGNTPTALQDGRCLVLHLVPFSSFDLNPRLSMAELSRHPDYFPPLGTSRRLPYSSINLDGFLTVSNADQAAELQRAYVQVSGSGVIEAVASGIAGGNNRIQVRELEGQIVHFSRIYAMALQELAIAPPYAVFVSLVGVEGIDLVTGRQMFDGSSEGRLAGRDQIHLTEAVLETVPTGDGDCGVKLRSILDHLANATGLPASLSFDQAGQYTLQYQPY
jgi:hypothetical protein